VIGLLVIFALGVARSGIYAGGGCTLLRSGKDGYGRMTTAIKFQQMARPPSVDRALTLV